MIRTIDVIHYAYKQAPWRIQRQWISAFLLVVLGLSMIAALYLDVTARAALTGRDIQNLSANIIAIQQSNADLETNIAMLTSYDAMEKRALAMNYQPAQSNQVQFIVVPGYIAPQPASLISAPSLQPSAPTIRPEYTQSLLDWFDQRLHTPVSISMMGVSQ
jgi:cell division protein FtsB